MTYKATGSTARSTCSLACKFSYVPPGTKVTHADSREEISKGWSESFLTRIGLESIVQRGYEQIGGVPGENGVVLTAGQPVGAGLTLEAARDLGLMAGTPVGSAVIDAYAGWIGTVAAKTSAEEPAPTLKDSAQRLAAVAGTSTCHLAQSEQGILVNGVWGPYPNAVFSGWWMNEGGQSSTGQLIDHVLTTHPAYERLQRIAKEAGTNEFDFLEQRLEALKTERASPSRTHLVRDLHFYPDLHGNRSPLADPKMRGMIMGLTLDHGLNDLALKFHVTLEAIALQTRHILEEMNGKGHKINSIYMSGSQAKNKPLMTLLATVCNVHVVIPPDPSAAVVVGAAMLGRCAADIAQHRKNAPIEIQKQAEEAALDAKTELWEIMVDMTKQGKVIDSTADEQERRLLDVKYKIFRESIEIQRRWRSMIAEAI